jgi:glycosyltransferase involved in cell wall biosynthesis
MNITIACYQAISLLHGGPRVQALQTKNELEKLGVNVSLFNPWEKFSSDKTDLVHLFSANLGTFHLARVLNSFSIPFVASSIFFSQHSPGFIKRAVALNNFFKKLRPGFWSDYVFTQQICQWASEVMPNTTEERRLLTEGLSIPKGKITIIPNGVEPRFEFGDPVLFKKKYGLDKFILNVGHIGPARKNVLNLIRAIKGIDHPAVIIGKITKGKYAEQCLYEANRNKNITIIEGLDNDSDMLLSAYAACDVFILPSLFETPGIAALEAALAGAKIAVTPYGGTKDYFGSMAVYTEPKSVDSIRKGIIDSLNRQKNSVLKEHVKKEYLWSRVAEKTLKVYERILGK